MKFPHALSALALLATLSACSVSPLNDRTADRPGTGAVQREQPAEPQIAAPAPTQTPAPQPPGRSYRAGIGTVESASIVSLPSSPSAAAGTTGPTMGYRLKMGDGTTQTVVQPGERFEVGDRVEITGDGRLIRR